MEELSENFSKGVARVDRYMREVNYAKHQVEIVNERASQNLATRSDQSFTAKYLKDAERRLKGAVEGLESTRSTLQFAENDVFSQLQCNAKRY